MGGEHVPKRLLPARAQGRHVDSLRDLLDVAVGQIQQRVHVRDAEFMAAATSPEDRIAGPDASFGDDTEVEARTMVSNQQIGHVRFAETHADAEARDARLGDLELGLTDAVPVADAHLAVGHAGDGEVLAEMARSQVVAREERRPVVVGLGLIHHDGALFTAVPGKVALTVAVDIEPAHHDGPFHGLLPDAGAHRLVLPLHVFGHTDVH